MALIPPPYSMTTMTAPSPLVANASSWYTSDPTSAYAPFHAFDNNSGNAWTGQGGGVDWLSLDLGSGNTIIAGSYSLTMVSSGFLLRCPKTWTFQGSNDNSSWTTVDTVASETGWSFGETRTFTCDTATTAYRYFRLNITANNGDGTYTEVDQMNIIAIVPGGLFRPGNLSGLGSGGPFFQNPLV